MIYVDLVRLEIPDELRGMTHRFIVTVDPGSYITELNEGNKKKTLRGWAPISYS